MRNYLTSRSNVWISLICAVLIISLSTVTFAGTILLLKAGSGTPGGSGPPVCPNTLDFSDACNSQYIPII